MYENPGFQVTLGQALTMQFGPVAGWTGDITGQTLAFYVVRQLQPNNPASTSNPRNLALLTKTPTLVSGPAGTYTVALLEADTLALGVGTFYYSVWRLDSGFGDEIANGSIKVLPTAKRYG